MIPHLPWGPPTSRFATSSATAPSSSHQALLFLGLRVDKGVCPPIESVIFVLRGRRDPWPGRGEHRVGWPESQFSGASFRIEPVYQRTVGELRGRPGLLWRVFTPLARDATPEALREVLLELRRDVEDLDERAEIYAAMAALADLRPWGYSLRAEIAKMLQQIDPILLRESAFVREIFEEGIEKGLEASVERTLRHLFVRRSGRTPTAEEEQVLTERAHGITPEKLADLADTLPGEALVRWLLAK